MDRCNAPLHHQFDECRCIVSPACLHAVRIRRMVSLEAVAAKSDFSREYLAGVERADKDKCIDAAVIRAYEAAIGAPLEGEVLDLLHEMAHTTVSCVAMFSRLYAARRDNAL